MSDWLYTPKQNKLIVESCTGLARKVPIWKSIISTGMIFLDQVEGILRSVRVFLKGVDEEEKEVQNADRCKVENRYEVKKEADSKSSTIGFSPVKASGSGMRSRYPARILRIPVSSRIGGGL